MSYVFCVHPRLDQTVVVGLSLHMPVSCGEGWTLKEKAINEGHANTYLGVVVI